jgi:dUTPase
LSKNIVAEFNKISFDQFETDWIDTFGESYFLNDRISNIIDIYNRIKSPKRATIGSAGYDIYTPIDIILQPGESIKIPTGLKCRIDEGWFMGIFPRSGHGFRYGLRITNTIGIIDSDYYYSDNQGHIFIKLINDSSINKTVKIFSGQAFAQAIFIPYGITVNDKVDNIRNGGLGSTN